MSSIGLIQTNCPYYLKTGNNKGHQCFEINRYCKNKKHWYYRRIRHSIKFETINYHILQHIQFYIC